MKYTGMKKHPFGSESQRESLKSFTSEASPIVNIPKYYTVVLLH